MERFPGEYNHLIRKSERRKQLLRFDPGLCRWGTSEGTQDGPCLHQSLLSGHSQDEQPSSPLDLHEGGDLDDHVRRCGLPLQENLDDFLALAEDLKLKGLRKRNHFDDGSKVCSPTSDPKSKTDQSHTLGTFPLVATDTYDEEQRAPDAISSGKGASSQNSQPNPDFTIEASQYYEKVQSMMDKSEKTYLNGARRAFYKICKVCGKEGTGTNIKGHIETNHLQGVLIPCNLCNENFASRNSLKLHKSRNHSTTNALKVESFLEETFKAETM